MVSNQEEIKKKTDGGRYREKIRDSAIKEIADLFATIGNPVRLKLLYLLREQSDKAMKWQEIQKIIGASGGSLKFHMDKLGAFHLIENYGGEYRITTKGIGLLYLVDILKSKVEKKIEIELEQYNIENLLSF